MRQQREDFASHLCVKKTQREGVSPLSSHLCVKKTRREGDSPLASRLFVPLHLYLLAAKPRGQKWYIIIKE